MQPTLYPLRQMGLIGSTDLIRSRPGSRRARPVIPPEPVVPFDLGDVVDAVDAEWRASSKLVAASV